MIKRILLIFSCLILSHCSSENTLGIDFLQQSRPSYFLRQLDSVKITGIKADTFWISSTASIANSIYSSFPPRSQLIGKFSNFKSILRYAFTLPKTLKTSNTFSVELATLTIPRTIFSQSDSSFIKNEGNTDRLQILSVQGVVQKFKENDSEHLSTALSQFILKQQPLSLSKYTSLASTFSTPFTTFQDTLNANLTNQTNSTHITQDTLRSLMSLLDSTSILDTLSNDSLVWVFLELEYLNLSTDLISRTSLPTLSLVIQNNSVVDSIKLIPRRKTFSFSSTYYARQVITHSQAFQTNPLLLTGLDQQIHFWINRDTILNAIKAQKPDFEHTALQSPTTTDYDHTYFVPYSRIHLPINTANVRVSGDYRLQFSVNSKLNSLSNPNNKLLQFSLKATTDSTLKQTTSILVTSPPFGDVIDTISLQYFADTTSTDSSYQFRISFNNQKVPADTIIIYPNQQRGYSYSGYNTSNYLYQLEFVLTSKQDSIFVGTFKNIVNNVERMDTIDFFSPLQQNTLVLNNTQGMQILLNRNITSNQYNEFTIKPVINPVISLDSIARSSQVFFSEIPLQTNSNGFLEFDLTIYYFKQSF